jgi:tetratricopeptide (TPR) repeat protein
MKEKHIQVLGICLTVVYGVFVAWLYIVAPKSLKDLPTKAQQTIESATSTAQVMTNTYEIDRAEFNQGLMFFSKENYIGARQSFAKADPEKRDARTQFYIAYSFYRQGWGRVTNDDALFRQALETTNRVIELDNNFKSDDAGLQMKTPAELKAELEQGLQVTAEDFNPLKLFRERK